MAYEIWDLNSRNMIAAFASEKRALGLIRRALASARTDELTSLALVYEDAEGQSRELARGEELLARALGDEKGMSGSRNGVAPRSDDRRLTGAR